LPHKAGGVGKQISLAPPFVKSSAAQALDRLRGAVYIMYLR